MRGRDAAEVLILKVNSTKVFTIVFSETKSIVNRNSKLVGQCKKCMEMDELAKQDHTYRLSKEEFEKYRGQWYLTLIKSGKNAPIRLRPDFRAAVSLKNRLHRESGEEICRTNISTAIQEMALFLKRFLVGHTSESWWSS